MGAAEETAVALTAKFRVPFPYLDEHPRRLPLEAETRVLSHGEVPLSRVRRIGGSRKRVVGLDPQLRPALPAPVGPDVHGGPPAPPSGPAPTGLPDKELRKAVPYGIYDVAITHVWLPPARVAALFGVHSGTTDRRIRDAGTSSMLPDPPSTQPIPDPPP